MSGGGIRFSTLTELWGAPKAGKSTFCYQCAGNFLEDYGDKAELKIIDSESAFDDVRMKFTFGLDIDDKRIESVGAQYVEHGMKSIEDWIVALPKDKYLMVIWDTLSTCPTKSAFTNTRDAKNLEALSMYSGGQGDRAKTIKHYARGLLSALYRKNVCLFFPTQIFSSISPYGPKEQSGDGSAFKHNLHYSFHFSRWGNSKINKELGYNTDTEDHISNFAISNVSLTKSRFSPEFIDSPIYINNQMGGLIDSRKSLFLHAHVVDEIIKHGAYYYPKYVFNKDTKKREYDPSVTGKYWDDLVNDDDVYNYLTKKILLETRKRHPIIDRVYLVQGYPELDKYYSCDDITERNESIKENTVKSKFDLVSFLSVDNQDNNNTLEVNNVRSKVNKGQEKVKQK